MITHKKFSCAPTMTDKPDPNPYKGVPNPELPKSEVEEAIFLNTLSKEEFESKIMPLNSRMYMYHVHNTDMCTSDEDSGPDLNASDSKDSVDDLKPAASDTNNSSLVAVKKEDVDLTVFTETSDAATQTPDIPTSAKVEVKSEPVADSLIPDVPTSATVPVKSEPDTDTNPPTSSPKVESPHSFSTASTARSSHFAAASCNLMEDDDFDHFSDSDPEVDKDAFLNKKKKRRSVKKVSRPINHRDMYGRTMLVAPPKKPMSPQDVIRNERCDYCGRIGDQCLNMRFGKFCVAYCYRYYHNNQTTFTQAGIVDKFKEAYKNAYDRDLFLKNQSLTMKPPPLMR